MHAITLEQLDLVTGAGFDWNRMVDNGNRYGTAGGILGGGAGAAIGVWGAGVGALPGATVGGLVGGIGGWLGGAGYDAWQQVSGH